MPHLYFIWRLLPIWNAGPRRQNLCVKTDFVCLRPLAVDVLVTCWPHKHRRVVQSLTHSGIRLCTKSCDHNLITAWTHSNSVIFVITYVQCHIQDQA